MDIILLPGPSTSPSILEKRPGLHFDPPTRIKPCGTVTEDNEQYKKDGLTMDINDLMVGESENGNDDKIKDTNSKVTSDQKTETSTSKLDSKIPRTEKNTVKQKDTVNKVKTAKLTVKKYLERTVTSKKTDHHKKGAKVKPNNSKIGKRPKSKNSR